MLYMYLINILKKSNRTRNDPGVGGELGCAFYIIQKENTSTVQPPESPQIYKLAKIWLKLDLKWLPPDNQKATGLGGQVLFYTRKPSIHFALKHTHTLSHFVEQRKCSSITAIDSVNGAISTTLQHNTSGKLYFLASGSFIVITG